jgi:hypothetical protein
MSVHHDINNLMSDAQEENIFLHEEATPLKHHDFVQELRLTVANHRDDELKQLLVEFNLLTQFLFMRKYYRTQIERSIERERQEREDEEEEANNRYWDDYDEFRRSRWSDYD